MKETCTSCGVTVNPQCEVCNGRGEVFVGEPGPATDIITAREDAAFLADAMNLALREPAINLIGCALVALKACVSLRHTPQVLLGKRKKEEGFELWVLPGGKQDLHESPEECVRRETLEEIGVTRLISLRPISFSYNSENPARKFLMLYYTAYVAGEEPYLAAPNEFSDLRWFAVDSLPSEMWQSDRDAIAQTLLMRPK